MTTKITLFGAGEKWDTGWPESQVFPVRGQASGAKPRSPGTPEGRSWFAVCPCGGSLQDADVVILAVPDTAIGNVFRGS